MGCIQPYSFSIHFPLRGTSRLPFGEDVRGCRHSSFSLPRKASTPTKDSISAQKSSPLLPKNETDFTQKEGTLSAKKSPNST